MPLKFKQEFNTAPVKLPQPKVQSAPTQINAIGTPIGMPSIGMPMIPMAAQPVFQPQAPPPLEIPGAGLKRGINYYADYGGCGWWRMIAPELLLNITQGAIINGLTTMVLDPRFYQGINAVRLQRQATPIQLDFMRFLKEGSKKFGFKIIYEVDDIIFKDDIPDFNRCKVAFEDENIFRSSLEMMQMCDEMSVASEFMKQYYMEKTGMKTISHIPNYPAKMWFDGHYSEEKTMKSFDKNKNRPRILYAGSGTHVDVMNKTNQKDDFAHVVDAIIKTRHRFKWVFVGCFPLHCKPFIDRGEMEFIPWFQLKDLHKAYSTTDVQAVYAPLIDCNFNRAKSNIKFLEAACCGIPGVFQNMVTYKEAFLHFGTGDELVDQMGALLKDENTYNNYSKKSRAFAESMWLDDHLPEFWELYFTNWGDPIRKELQKRNPDQLVK